MLLNKSKHIDNFSVSERILRSIVSKPAVRGDHLDILQKTFNSIRILLFLASVIESSEVIVSISPLKSSCEVEAHLNVIILTLVLCIQKAI